MKHLKAEARATLQPTRELQEAHLAEADQRIHELRQLVARRQALVTRLRRVQEEANAERESIDAAFVQVMRLSEQPDNAMAGTT